jgi:hypothetical protein
VEGNGAAELELGVNVEMDESGLRHDCRGEAEGIG